MSHADTAGRAPCASSRFATIKAALNRQKRDLARASRRWSSLLPAALRRQAAAGALQAGIEPLRLLQVVLDHADVIALDEPQPYHAQQVHLLLTVPVYLLERATVIASYDVDDEDSHDAEPEDDDERGQDDEPSIATPDGIIDQRRITAWHSDRSDGERDTADMEPSLGSCDGEMNQARWAAGDGLDRERGEGGPDCDDDEPDHDNEPDERDDPMHGDPEYAAMATARIIEVSRAERRLGELMAQQPVQHWQPTGNGNEMRCAETGETGRWMLLPRNGDGR